MTHYEMNQDRGQKGEKGDQGVKGVKGDTGGNGRTVTYAVVASAFGTLLVLIVAFLLNSGYNAVCKLQESKLDKGEFYAFVGQISKTADRLDNKMDSMLKALGEHERNSKR